MILFIFDIDTFELNLFFMKKKKLEYFSNVEVLTHPEQTTFCQIDVM